MAMSDKFNAHHQNEIRFVDDICYYALCFLLPESKIESGATVGDVCSRYYIKVYESFANTKSLHADRCASIRQETAGLFQWSESETNVQFSALDHQRVLIGTSNNS